MKTEHILYPDNEEIEIKVKNIKYTSDCGLYIGDNLVCDRCGVPYASHS